MTRHCPFAHTTAPRRRRSMGSYVHVAVSPVVRHADPVRVTATVPATWPGNPIRGMPAGPHAEVRAKRSHTSKHKSP